MTIEETFSCTCEICGTTFIDSASYAWCCEKCKAIRDRKMTQKQYVNWLEAMRDRIEAGLELSYYDDNTIGNKSLFCSWGMCNNKAEVWPEELHQIPGHTIPGYQGGIRHIDRDRKTQHCPFDARVAKTGGCFWRCVIFQHKVITKEQGLAYYDLLLNHLKGGN